MDVGEEVSRASRRGPGVGDLGGESEVREDLANDSGILDGGDQAHAAAAVGASEHVEVEGAAHQVGPGPVVGSAGRLATEFGDVGCSGVP